MTGVASSHQYGITPRHEKLHDGMIESKNRIHQRKFARKTAMTYCLLAIPACIITTFSRLQVKQHNTPACTRSCKRCCTNSGDCSLSTLTAMKALSQKHQFQCMHVALMAVSQAALSSLMTVVTGYHTALPYLKELLVKLKPMLLQIKAYKSV